MTYNWKLFFAAVNLVLRLIILGLLVWALVRQIQYGHH